MPRKGAVDGRWGSVGGGRDAAWGTEATSAHRGMQGDGHIMQRRRRRCVRSGGPRVIGSAARWALAQNRPASNTWTCCAALDGSSVARALPMPGQHLGSAVSRASHRAGGRTRCRSPLCSRAEERAACTEFWRQGRVAKTLTQVADDLGPAHYRPGVGEPAVCDAPHTAACARLRPSEPHATFDTQL